VGQSFESFPAVLNKNNKIIQTAFLFPGVPSEQYKDYNTERTLQAICISIVYCVVGPIWVQLILIQIYSHSRNYCRYRYRHISTKILATDTDIFILPIFWPLPIYFNRCVTDTDINDINISRYRYGRYRYPVCRYIGQTLVY
jgi:hypothetical protein